MTDRKVYIPNRVLVVLQAQPADLSLEARNRELYRQFPDISQRSLRRYSSAYVKNNYTDELVQPHYTKDNFVYEGVVPPVLEERDWKTWVRRLRALQKRGEPIRFVNIQDVHIETADRVLLDMCLTIAADFEPHLMPVMCDVVDNALFARRRHGSSYFNYKVHMVKPPSLTDSAESAVEFFLKATQHYIAAVKERVPNAQLFALLGNHEAWALDFIHQYQEVGSIVIKQLFKMLRRYEVLWPKSSTVRELPITDSVIALHGWSTRSSNYGANANAYLRYYEGVSVIAGHAHRMEVAWSRPDYSTNGQRFAAVTGTLGSTRPQYAQQAYIGHTLGFQLIQLAPSGHVGHHVENVTIHYKDGYYSAFANGRQYRAKALLEQHVNPFVQKA